MSTDKLPFQLPMGLYERILDPALRLHLQSLAHEGIEASLKTPSPPDQPAMLAAALRQRLEVEFERVLEDAGLKDQEQLFQALCLAIEKPGLLLSFYNTAVDAGVEALEALYPHGTALPPRPDTPMSVNCLLTGTDSEPHLASQLKKELASADRCDILCSFIKWSGLRLLWDELTRFVGTPGH